MAEENEGDMNQARKRVFSGVQPTGKLHIGNYIGALSLWAENQSHYDNIFCVVDLHALTIPESVHPARLHEKIRETAALYIASGIDPERSIVFVQSRVGAHAELSWLLNCVTPLGWLERMTQFKVKSKAQESVGSGLLNYPVLQAADILLYATDLVPVGEDQRQHIELTRDIAVRFNRLFGEVFTLPMPMIRKSGARIMAFDDPSFKMSKSLGEERLGHSVGLLDSHDTIHKTIMRAATDSGNETRFEFASPGVLNLLTLCEVLTGQTKSEIEVQYVDKGYGYLKQSVSELLISTLEPVQRRFHELMADESALDRILDNGAERAQVMADETLEKVKSLIGLG